MNISYTDRFLKSYRQAPLSIQRKFIKQVRFLELDLRYPSLHAKKYDEALDIWQARVDRNWRFYFQIKSEQIYLIDIMTHPK